MNPGLTDEVGKVAVAIVDGMKAQPVALGLLVLNMLFLAVFYFLFSTLSARTASDLEREDALLAKMVDKCK